MMSISKPEFCIPCGYCRIHSFAVENISRREWRPIFGHVYNRCDYLVRKNVFIGQSVLPAGEEVKLMSPFGDFNNCVMFRRFMSSNSSFSWNSMSATEIWPILETMCHLAENKIVLELLWMRFCFTCWIVSVKSGVARTCSVGLWRLRFPRQTSQVPPIPEFLYWVSDILKQKHELLSHIVNVRWGLMLFP